MNLIVQMQFGSYVYGTSVPTSDVDIKGVYLPSAEDILLQRIRGTVSTTTKSDLTAKNTADDVDTEIFSLDRYLNLLLQGQTVALDMLFTPNEHFIFDDSVRHLGVWLEIRRNRRYFLHSGVSSFAGYCRTQANKYGIKGSRMAAVRAVLALLESKDAYSKLDEHTPELFALAMEQEHANIVACRGPNGQDAPHLEVCNRKVPMTATVKYALGIFQRIFDEYGHRARLAEANNGIDWKALQHAVRVAAQAKELLLTGNITFPRPEAATLLQIRKGELPYKQVAEMIEQGLEELESAQTASVLPAEPDRAVAEEIIYRAYAESVRNAPEAQWRELCASQ